MGKLIVVVSRKVSFCCLKNRSGQRRKDISITHCDDLDIYYSVCISAKWWVIDLTCFSFPVNKNVKCTPAYLKDKKEPTNVLHFYVFARCILGLHFQAHVCTLCVYMYVSSMESLATCYLSSV